LHKWDLIKEQERGVLSKKVVSCSTLSNTIFEFELKFSPLNAKVKFGIFGTYKLEIGWSV